MIAYLTAHYRDIAAILTLVVGTARLIVKLTPTPADDTVLDKIVTVLLHLGLHIDPTGSAEDAKNAAAAAPVK